MWIRTCRCGRFPVRSELKEIHLRFCQISWQPEFGGCGCFNWLACFLFQYQSILNLCLCEFNFSLFRSYYKLKQVDLMNFWVVLCRYWSQLKLMVWPRLLAFCLIELHIFCCFETDLLCSPGWPCTWSHPPASVFWVLVQLKPQCLMTYKCHSL